MDAKGCAIEGCLLPYKARGWCRIHYSRWYSKGDPLWMPSRQRGVYTDPYIEAHMKLRRERGQASDYECVDCGGQALDWSFRGHEDPNVKFSFEGEDYEPRCRKCHSRFDRKALKKVG